MKTSAGKKFFNLLAISASAVALSAGVANAEVILTNPNTVAGSATATQVNPNQVDINQVSQSAIMEADDFQMTAAGDQMNIFQPNSDSNFLLRVVGNNASVVRARIDANGNLFLINSNGMLFTSTAEINVNSFIGSPIDTENSNFMAGNFNFNIVPDNPGGIINQGKITANTGGLVALVAPGVENSGTIRANLGKVTLASGEAFTVDFYGDKLINFATPNQVSAPPAVGPDGQPMDHQIHNSGDIIAHGGQVVLEASSAAAVLDQVINMDGVIAANTFLNQEGDIVLASDAGTISVSGEIRANGNLIGWNAGNVTIESDGAVDVDGEISARAFPLIGNGGNVYIRGDEEVMLSGANINLAGGFIGENGLLTVESDAVNVQQALDTEGNGVTELTTTDLNNFLQNADLEVIAADGNVTIKDDFTITNGDNVTFAASDDVIVQGNLSYNPDGTLALFAGNDILTAGNGIVNVLNGSLMMRAGRSIGQALNFFDIGSVAHLTARAFTGNDSEGIFIEQADFSDPIEIGESAEVRRRGGDVQMDGMRAVNGTIFLDLAADSVFHNVLRAESYFVNALYHNVTLAENAKLRATNGTGRLTGDEINFLGNNHVFASNDLIILSSYNINATGDDVYLRADGSVFIDSFFNITSSGERFIVRAINGDVFMTAANDIDLGGYNNRVISRGGDVTITTNGGFSMGENGRILVDVGNLSIDVENDINIGMNTRILANDFSFMDAGHDIFIGDNVRFRTNGMLSMFARNDITFGSLADVDAGAYLVNALNDVTIGNGASLSAVTTSGRIMALNNIMFNDDSRIRAESDLILLAAHNIFGGDNVRWRANGSIFADSFLDIVMGNNFAGRAITGDIDIFAANNVDIGNNGRLVSRFGDITVQTNGGFSTGESGRIIARNGNIYVDVANDINIGNLARIFSNGDSTWMAGNDVVFGERTDLDARGALTVWADNNIHFLDFADAQADSFLLTALRDIHLGFDASLRTVAGIGKMIAYNNIIMDGFNKVVSDSHLILLAGNSLLAGDNVFLGAHGSIFIDTFNNIYAGNFFGAHALNGNIFMTVPGEIEIGDFGRLVADLGNIELIANGGDGFYFGKNGLISAANGSISVDVVENIHVDSLTRILSAANSTWDAGNNVHFGDLVDLDAGGTFAAIAGNNVTFADMSNFKANIIDIDAGNLVSFMTGAQASTFGGGDAFVDAHDLEFQFGSQLASNRNIFINLVNDLSIAASDTTAILGGGTYLGGFGTIVDIVADDIRIADNTAGAIVNMDDGSTSVTTNGLGTSQFELGHFAFMNGFGDFILNAGDGSIISTTNLMNTLTWSDYYVTAGTFGTAAQDITIRNQHLNAEFNYFGTDGGTNVYANVIVAPFEAMNFTSGNGNGTIAFDNLGDVVALDVASGLTTFQQVNTTTQGTIFSFTENGNRDVLLENGQVIISNDFTITNLDGSINDEPGLTNGITATGDDFDITLVANGIGTVANPVVINRAIQLALLGNVDVTVDRVTATSTNNAFINFVFGPNGPIIPDALAQTISEAEDEEDELEILEPTTPIEAAKMTQPAYNKGYFFGNVNLAGIELSADQLVAALTQ